MRRTPYLERMTFVRRQCREAHRETAQPASQTGGSEVCAAAVGERPGSHDVIDQDIQANRRVGVRILRSDLNFVAMTRIDAPPLKFRSSRFMNARAHRETFPDRLHRVSVRQARGAVPRRLTRQVGVEADVFIHVVTHHAAVVIDEGFLRRGLGPDHSAAEIQVEIPDAGKGVQMEKTDAVDQFNLWHKDTVNEHRVSRRHPHVPFRHAVRHRAGQGTERRDIALTCDEAAGTGVATDPAGWRGAAGTGHDVIPDRQILHRHLTAVSQDTPTAAAASSGVHRGGCVASRIRSE